MSERVEAGEYNYGFRVNPDGAVTAATTCDICGTDKVILGCTRPGCRHVWCKVEQGDLRVIVADGDRIERVEAWTGYEWLRLRGVEPSGLRLRLFRAGIEAVVEAQFYGPAKCFAPDAAAG